MYQQLFFTQKQDELLNVVSAEEHLLNRIGSRTSPFLPPPFWVKVTTKIVRMLFVFVQKLVGTKLYVANDLRELNTIKPQLRNLLLLLIKKDIIHSWRLGYYSPDLPHIVTCGVKFKGIYGASGKRHYFSGAAGEGYGRTANEALTVSLAEFLERYSLCNIDEKKIIFGSFEKLQRRGAVNPSVFTFYSKQQLKHESFISSRVNRTQSFGWIKALSLISKKQRLIPAQLVYMFYNEEHEGGPEFWNSTTSGVAAGITLEEASLGAICESVERDAFLIFWLNSIAPPQIILESIPNVEIQKLIKEIKQYDLELFILDITTDIHIPTFSAVFIDRNGETAVAVTAVTDFNIEYAIKKVILDAIKFKQHPPNMSSSFLNTIQKKFPNIETTAERHSLWADKKMISNIDFFLRGEKKKFSDITYTNIPKTSQLYLSEIKKIFKEKKYDCYLVDITSKEARRAGLYVVKAVIPQLMPMYFKENKKHLGVKRLCTVPKQLGFLNTPKKDDDFNTTLHPFV